MCLDSTMMRRTLASSVACKVRQSSLFAVRNSFCRLLMFSPKVILLSHFYCEKPSLVQLKLIRQQCVESID